MRIKQAAKEWKENFGKPGYFDTWYRVLIGAVVEDQREYTGGEVRSLPPMGLGSHVMITLEGGGTLTLGLGRIEEGELVVIDTRTNLNRYPPGSIGYLNGFNHPEIPLPGTVEELVALFG